MNCRLITENDVVVLWTSDNRARTVRVLKSEIFRTHLGDLALCELIGREYGCRFELVHGWGLALPPSMEDRMRTARRSTNIIYPKDAGLILMKMVIGPGSKVIELGTGSGAMTIALAHAVSPGGEVYSFDVRDDFLRAAQRNFRRSGLKGNVHFADREPGEPLPVGPVDSIIMDIPEPWEEIDVVVPALNRGGRVASMNPSYNQVEKMAAAMKSRGFILIECVETIFRRIVVAEGRVRPSRIAIPHTEFMLFGIKSGEPMSEDVDQYYPER